uniref:Uncharacterized protein n=1 Tax=Plectus sambesii TaxID=2011161 RepID=A0A914V5Q4_9BILA
MMSDLTPRKLSESSAKNWSQRPLSDEMLLLVVEEARLLAPALYKILNNALPAHARTLFEQKCAESLLPNPNRPPPPAQNAPEPPKKQAPYRPPQMAAAAQAQTVGQQNGVSSKATPPSMSSSSNSSSNSSPSKCPNCSSCATPKKMVDSATQTFSTGEITALAVLYDM